MLYGSTVIEKDGDSFSAGIVFSLLTLESDVYRRQILTSKDGPRAA